MLYVNPVANVSQRLIISGYQVLCKTAASVDRAELLLCELPQTQRVTSRYIRLTERSSSGESSIVISPSSPDSLTFRTVAARLLRLVVSRRPVALQPCPESAPSYLTAYVVETLECGHSQDYHFIEGAENLTAKRRLCIECNSLHRKKPQSSVRVAPQAKEAL